MWVNPDAAANRIRVSIDDLLTALKIPQSRNTHERINLFRKKNAKAAEYLEAVKWIGNDGSHETGLTVNDILDDLELLSYALTIIYPNRDNRIEALAKKINSNKTIKVLHQRPPF